MSTYIGIDPGVSGGIALIDQGPVNSEAGAVKMPATERDIWEAIRDMGTAVEPFAYIERLGAMPRDEHGKARQNPTTMFKMGVNYGLLRMCLIASGIPFDEVLPRKWQADFGLLRRPSETITQKKNRHKQKAQQLWPSLKITHAIADALLICEYCRRIRTSNCESSHAGGE